MLAGAVHWHYSTTQEPCQAAQPVVHFPTLTLQGLTYRGSNSSAVINGRVVRVGERVEGVQVIMIDRNSVWVELDGQTNRIWSSF